MALTIFCRKAGLARDTSSLPDTETALNDSGCQLSLVRADTVKPLNLHKLGEAKLKGLSDDLVFANIVRIRVRLTSGCEFVNITCAVVEKLNYSLILCSDIVNKLNLILMDEEFGLKELMNAMHDENNDNNMIMMRVVNGDITN